MVEDVSEVLVREATPDDAEPIAAVHIASWREAYAGVLPDAFLDGLDVAERADEWREILTDTPRGMSIWVAEDEGRVVGFASLGPSRDEDAERTTLEIYTIYLEPSAWGHGIARELMRTVLAEVPEGAPVTLWSLDSNARANHFYRRNGFVRDGVEKVEQIGGQYYTEVRHRRG